MIRPEVLDALLAAGATAEMIVAAVKADAAIEASRLTERRTKDADRQRRHRRSRRVTVTPCDAPLNDNSSNPPSEPEGSKEIKVSRKKVLSIQVPEWMPPEAWLAMVAMRKGMRGGSFTDAAAKLLISRIDELRGQGHCPEKLLNKAVLNGWKTVYPAEDTKATKAGKPKTAEWYDDQAKFFDGLQNSDEAQRCRAEAAKLRQSRGPPKAVGDLAGKVLRRAEG